MKRFRWCRGWRRGPRSPASGETVLAIIIVLALTCVVTADEPTVSGAEETAKSAASFLRLTRDDQQLPVALETAIVRCRSRADPNESAVDLVAALHIADKSYYEQLNREFACYDAVLYELIAGEEAKIPRRGESGGNHPISLFQNGMKDLLGLEFQLKAVDYTAKNMVHADMSPEEFAQSMQQRGESVMEMFTRMMGYAMAKQSQSSDAMYSGRLLLALFDKNRTLAMKRVMAEQFSENDGSLAALDGPTGSTLIGGRNEIVIEALRRQIAAGKRKIAIFYGAGHMPDMQKRLRDVLHLEPADTRWLVAWSLRSGANVAKP
jgi:hypothetical protein